MGTAADRKLEDLEKRIEVIERELTPRLSAMIRKDKKDKKPKK